MQSLHLPIPLSLLIILLLNALHLSSSTTDLHDLLPSYNLPRGLIPDNVKSYTISPSGDFTVQLTKQCYVHFDNDLVWYNKEIKGKLSYGAVKGVSGIEAQKLIFWLPVTGIEVSGDGVIEFFVGSLSKKFPASHFDEVPSCERNVGGSQCQPQSQREFMSM